MPAAVIDFSEFIDRAPIPITIDDWAGVCAMIDAGNAWSVPDIVAWVDALPGRREAVQGAVKGLAANPATRDLLGAVGARHAGPTVFSRLRLVFDEVLRALQEGRPMRPRDATLCAGDRQAVHLRVLAVKSPTRADPRSIAVLVDRTEERRAVDALAASERMHRQIVQDQTEFVVRYRPDGVRTFVNQAYADYFGGGVDDFVGTTFFDLIDARQRDAVRAKVEALSRGEVALQDEHLSLRADGQLRWTSWVDRAIFDDSGRLLEIQAVGRDITRVKEAEAERLRLQAELAQAQKMEAVGTLAGGIAHDFNNLLTGILGCATMILMDEPPAPVGDHARAIQEAAERAGELTSQLLAVSRRSPPRMGPCDLGGVARQTARLLQRSIPPTVRVKLALDAALPAQLADANQLGHALLNLGINARDAMPGGGVLTIGTALAVVKAERAAGHNAAPGRYAVLSVEDTGVGIPADVLPRIFEPFFTTRADGGGTGLGLAMVYSCVQAHGGWIEVDSEEGRGTQFSLYIPLVPSDRVVVGRGNEGLPSGTETVLLVDDTDIVLMQGRGLLERCGYTVITAWNGSEALQILEQRRVDVVVTDLVMPRMGGRELLRQIRRLHPDLPVVLTSGYAMDAESQLRAEGYSVFIPKPFTPADLSRAVRDVLDRRTSATARK